ncbi:MAG TPA: N,N-dimethylformamidase beta subunit family domain-containing protein [Noviherbaspirillum sp.]|uniref:N,N-dimethylformamidase beta subunit family domain-containing protein n=1 Tax=Noviherbaspirillum sp. TaxID=1926288 RepID=UPI002D3F69D6|nr:N,N-dimethylformamidase beta subunit family domain-containing protein [Noviherbaspirillum sp.]HYD95579.1 N,N-dimethylformamidase beta subunit family domain-containing protein [Noviherbaspirillum sp.]
MIQGYPARASVAPGERLTLHIATDAARFRVVFYRWHGGMQPMHESRWLTGRQAAPKGAAEDWEWPAYEFAIPPDWPSSVYIAHLEEPGAAAPSVAMTSAAALFVVRGAGRSRLLYKIPLATYHAYNFTGGGCFYVNQPRSETPPGTRVSLRRPGGGIGGETWGALDHYDSSSPRQTFAHWDARFIGWLAQNGYDAEFCTDIDLHEDPDLCSRYRLMLSVGHDEYWSEAVRDCVEAFVRRGGNVAFFGANLCWWRIHIVDNGGAMVCHQGSPRGAFDHWWPPTGANRPEDALTGASYRHGGGWWDGPRETGGFIVQAPEHWVFAGTGLTRGASFGRDTVPPLVGYECDGAPLAAFDTASGIVQLSPDAARCGTPPGFCVLAAGLLGEGWQERPPREGMRAGEGVHAATIGIFSRGGTVFTAGTTDWAQVLASGTDARVDRITRNVLDGLLRPS